MDGILFTKYDIVDIKLDSTNTIRGLVQEIITNTDKTECILPGSEGSFVYEHGSWTLHQAGRFYPVSVSKVVN